MPDKRTITMRDLNALLDVFPNATPVIHVNSETLAQLDGLELLDNKDGAYYYRNILIVDTDA